MDGNKLRGEVWEETCHLAKKMAVCAVTVILACLIGIFIGAYSTAFAHALKAVNNFRAAHPAVLFLLPFAGLVIIFLYRKCGLYDDKGTNLVLSSVGRHDHIPAVMSVLIFISTLLTHLCGGSAGREGAALQMGGSLGSAVAKLFKQNEETTKLLIMCGMSAAFAAVFGTPLAAAVFSLEVISVGIMHYSALLPCVFSAVTAACLASNLGIEPETFSIVSIPELSVSGSLIIFLLAVLCAGISALFIIVLHGTGHLYKKFLKNPYVRVFVGGLIIIALTLISGNMDYNGAGMNLIEAAVLEEDAEVWSFAVKMIFTALTLQAGFKGGEIVPSLCIGATFGCVFGQIAGFSPSFCAAVGMAAVFCGVTNCPMTTLFLSFELFGFEGVPYFMMAIAVSYMLSGYSSLYSSQKIMYSKYRLHYINRSPGDGPDDL